jgi:general secretion pathway protein K
MSDRRGFALLTVLWLVAGLGALAAGTLALARVGAGASRNRIVLVRAAWARNACEEIVLARYAAQGRIAPLDSVDLGAGVWCGAGVEEAGTRLDLNLASPEALRAVLGDSLADPVLDWRDADDLARPLGAERDWYAERKRAAPRNAPLAAVAELRLLRGFDTATVRRVEPLLTVSGDARMDLNVAPREVVASLPGLDPAAVATILARRAVHPIATTDELLALLPPSSRETLLGRFQEFTARAGYAPARVRLRIRGLAGHPALVSEERMTAVPVPGRLAVIRRELL